MADSDDDYKKYGKAVKGETKAQAATRKSAYYTGQRKAAEKSGDVSTLSRISSKLSGKQKADETAKTHAAAQKAMGLNASEANARNAGAAPGTLKARVAGAGAGMLAGEGLGGLAARALGPVVKGLASKFIPEGEAMAGSGARKAIGAAKALTGGKKIPTGGAKSGRYESMAVRKARETAAQQKGSLKPRVVGSQKALPAPKGDAPAMQHRTVKAGSARSQQATARNKGTNPRAVRAKAATRKPTESKDLLATLKESVRQAKAKKKAS